MRALLSTIGSRGDVQPLIALASELKALGHDVRLCVPPDFQESIEALGLAVAPIGPDLRKATAAPSSPAGPLSPERRRQLAEATVATQFETIAAVAADCDIIVAATALQIAARSVAEKRGIPYVFVAYCPVVLPSAHHAPPPLPPIPGQPSPPANASADQLWTLDGERFHGLFGDALNTHRTAIGLGPVDDTRGHVFTARPWLAADPTLAPWPDPAGGAVFQTGAWILPDQRELPRELAAFLDAGDPPIYFGFGSMRAPQDLGATMIESARALGRRAVVSRGWAGVSAEDDGGDWIAVGEVNQQALFARCALVVHHGGAGTTTTAALSGSPQVVVPQIYDQHYWARRVRDLGIGSAHAAGAPTVESLTSAVEQALSRDVVERARLLAATVRRDGARTAAQRVAAIVDNGRM